MDVRIREAIAQGGGVVTTARLRGIPIDPRVIARHVRMGDLVAIRRGVYTSRELWEGWGEFTDRPLARIRAASLTMTMPHVLSHDSAAVLHGIPLIDVRRSDVHVTRPRVIGSRHRHGVHHYGAPYSLDDVDEIDGFRVLSKARTVADLARTHGYDAGLVAADGALRRGVTRAELSTVLGQMSCWPGITTCRAVVEDADPGAETAAETLGRILVRELGVQDLETQFPVRTDDGVRWCDIRVGCHLVEVHGRVKLRGVQDGGVADSPPEHVVWREKKRERLLASRGLGISNLVWADFWEPQRTRALARLRAEYAVTEQRFGRTLPAHLEEDAQRLRGLRRRSS